MPLFLPASDFVAATQAQMETATSNLVGVTPGRVQFHPGAAKGWSFFNGTGTPGSSDSYNFTSITDNGTGDFTLVWGTDFSSADHCAVGSSAGIMLLNALAAGSTRVNTYAFGIVLTDYAMNAVIVYGDQ